MEGAREFKSEMMLVLAREVTMEQEKNGGGKGPSVMKTKTTGMSWTRCQRWEERKREVRGDSDFDFSSWMNKVVIC